MSFFEMTKLLGFGIIAGLVINMIFNFGYGFIKGYVGGSKKKNGK